MNRDPLFAGLTRPPTLFGIPSDAFGILLMVLVLAFIMLKSFLVILAFPVVYAIARAVCAKDPRMFRYLLLAAQTKGRGMNRALWQGSSYSPLRFRKR